jgi:hypothetical protein
MLEIKQGNNCFYIGESQENHDAIINYFSYGQGVIAINHTFVKEELRGQNIARQLLNKVVEKARKDNLKIAPMCSYASNVFNKSNEYDDVYFK